MSARRRILAKIPLGNGGQIHTASAQILTRAAKLFTAIWRWRKEGPRQLPMNNFG
jgi:hypothetical protein